MFKRILALALLLTDTALAAPSSSVIETRHIDSTVLRENRIDLPTRRSLKVYLPPGYAASKTRLPVVYMLHGLGWSNERMFGPGSDTQATFDKAIADGVIKPFIAVAPDYSTPGPGSFFANSPTSGRFEDFTVQEVVTFIDSNYRTLARPESRAIMGEHLGAYGALLYAFHHPEVWSTVYALHPVGTGTGLVPMWSRPDWSKVKKAKSLADLAGEPYTPVFLAMAQTFLPNAQKPPFYCDLIVNLDGETATLDVANSRLLRSRFLLDEMLVENLERIGKLRGIRFDWGRYDPNQDHVFSNQAFTRKLEELGVEHEAEEFRGLPWDRYWIAEGRVYTEVLPFFARRLEWSH